MNPLASASNCVLVEHLRVRVVGQGRRDGVLDLVPVGTRRDLHQRRGDELRPREGGLLVELDHEVVHDPALGVVDADDLERGACRWPRTPRPPCRPAPSRCSRRWTWTPRRCPRRDRRANPPRGRAASGHRRWPGRRRSSWSPGRRTAPFPSRSAETVLDAVDVLHGSSTVGLNPGPWALALVTKRSASVLSPITSPKEAFSEEAKTLMLTTRVRPIISAAAVAAGTTRVARRVLLGQLARQPAELHRRRDHRRQRTDRQRQRHDDADERGEQAEPKSGHAGVPEQRRPTGPRHPDRGAVTPANARRFESVLGARNGLAQRLDRTHPGGTTGRDHGGHDGDDRADEHRDDDRCAGRSAARWSAG